MTGDLWRGVAFVVWGGPTCPSVVSLPLAVRLARLAGWPVAVITDEATAPAIPPGVQVHLVESWEPYDKGGHHFFRKYAVLEKQPFAATLYLDTDCHVLGDLTLWFQSAEAFGLALTHDPAGTMRYGGHEWPMFQSGAFCNALGRVDRERLINGIIEFAHQATKECLILDKAALSLAVVSNVWPHTVLPPVFNLCRQGTAREQSVRVIHTKESYQTSANLKLYLRSDNMGNPLPLPFTEPML